MNDSIWVYMDLRSERFFIASLNALAKAKELAGKINSNAVAVIIGSPDDALWCGSSEKTFAKCIENGADQILHLESEFLAQPRIDIFADALNEVLEVKSPKWMFFALNDFSRELAAKISAKRKAGLIADCAEIEIEDNCIKAFCPSWGGEIMAELVFADSTSTGFLTCLPNTFDVTPVKSKGILEKIAVKGLKKPENLELISVAIQEQKSAGLENADAVVVGGAGLGNRKNFTLVRELAAALGGEAGATRPPVLQHWIDEDRMIGQTGKSIQPRLLISIGTSGAVQYTAGINGADLVIAINKDKNAPIFQVADIGIVTDAKNLLPLLIKLVKENVLRGLADIISEDNLECDKQGFGSRMARLREAQEWTREDLAEMTGQTLEFIEQVELGEVSPSVSFIMRLSKALGADPNGFLLDDEKRAVAGEREQAFKKRARNYSYQTLTPGAENQCLRAFMVTIESKKDHKPVAYKHEGEEFIYVMAGELELTLGGKVYHLKQFESKHFNSEISHKLKSLSNEPTQCLVVLYAA